MSTYKSVDEQFQAAVRALAADGNDVLGAMVLPAPDGGSQFEVRAGLIRHPGAATVDTPAGKAQPWYRELIVRLVHAVTAETYPEDAYETPVPFPVARPGTCLLVAWAAASGDLPVHVFLRGDPSALRVGRDIPAGEVVAGLKLLVVRALAAVMTRRDG